MCRFILILPFVALANSAFAWNMQGHEVVALVAYNKLGSSQVRDAAVTLLKQHPRFVAHFQMPQNVANGSDAEKNQWIFAHAAAWPDQVKQLRNGVTSGDRETYSRRVWHYIDVPVFLNPSEQHLLEGNIHPNLAKEPMAGNNDTDMNIIQAFKKSSSIVADHNRSPQDRAVHLCWIMHLAGDAHQPLHAAALYTSQRFDTDKGDGGGNGLITQGRTSLHSYWDDAIITSSSFTEERNKALQLGQDSDLVAEATAAANTIDVEDWINDTHELAKVYAYNNEILGKVADAEGQQSINPLHPSHQYRLDSSDLARSQAMSAGYRLAAVLQELLQ